MYVLYSTQRDRSKYFFTKNFSVKACVGTAYPFRNLLGEIYLLAGRWIKNKP